MSEYRSIREFDPSGSRVLVRVDFNVPLNENGHVTDDRRIQGALPTIHAILDGGGSVILMSHLGRPKGEGHEPALSMGPVADRLSELLGRPVVIPGPLPTSAEAVAAAGELQPGEVVLLENLRFEKGEKKGDPEFASILAGMADAYCTDAFGTAHRADASMVAVPEAMGSRPKLLGCLMAKEVEYLGLRLADAKETGGFVAILGGAKVSDKIPAIRNLAGKVDTMLVGGAMAYTLLAACGGKIGASRCEEDILEACRDMLAEAESAGTTVLLPTDHVVAAEFSKDAEASIVSGDIPDGLMGLDIGPETCQAYADVLAAAKTIVWNGPMGVFEWEAFRTGTAAVGEAVARASEGAAIGIVGGGDTAAAAELLGVAERVSHVSTGGGASLAMLEGSPMPGLDAVAEK